MPTTFRVKLLGRFRLQSRAGTELAIPSRKGQALMAVLALAGGQAVARERLAALLWSDRGEQQARSSLRQALTELRKALPDLDPPLLVADRASVGLDPDAIEIGEVSYVDQGRARVAGRNQGLVRIYARRAGCQLVGAEMFGPRVEHMAHLLAWATQEGMTVQHALRMPFYHPVVEEGLRTALRGLAAKLEVTGDCRSEDLAEAPGA